MLWRCQLVRTCTASLQDLLWWHRLVDGSYERCEADMRALCDMAADDVLASDFRVEILRPAYYIAKDDKQKRGAGFQAGFHQDSFKQAIEGANRKYKCAANFFHQDLLYCSGTS